MFFLSLCMYCKHRLNTAVFYAVRWDLYFKRKGEGFFFFLLERKVVMPGETWEKQYTQKCSNLLF